MSNCAHCGAQVGEDYKFCPSCGKDQSGQLAPGSHGSTDQPPQGAPVPPQAKPKSGLRPWMIVGIVLACVLFVATIIVGIIAAIAVPNLLNAVQRGKQKRTMADMRSLGNVMDTYEIDNKQYPLDVDELKPKYLKNPPMLDGWGNPWVTTFGPREYTIVSLGKNGIPDGAAFYGGTTSTFNDDIVYSSGKFIQYPDGKQTNH
jgi:type II secretory pathway pseudopilin PulG